MQTNIKKYMAYPKDDVHLINIVMSSSFFQIGIPGNTIKTSWYERENETKEAEKTTYTDLKDICCVLISRLRLTTEI